MYTVLLPLDMQHPELRAALDEWLHAVGKYQRARSATPRAFWRVRCQEAYEAVEATRARLFMSAP